jgi:hypothetical protein
MHWYGCACLQILLSSEIDSIMPLSDSSSDIDLGIGRSGSSRAGARGLGLMGLDAELSFPQAQAQARASAQQQQQQQLGGLAQMSELLAGQLGALAGQLSMGGSLAGSASRAAYAQQAPQPGAGPAPRQLFTSGGSGGYGDPLQHSTSSMGGIVASPAGQGQGQGGMQARAGFAAAAAEPGAAVDRSYSTVAGRSTDASPLMASAGAEVLLGAGIIGGSMMSPPAEAPASVASGDEHHGDVQPAAAEGTLSPIASIGSISSQGSGLEY